MAHDDFQFEPLPGLPAHLPQGEEILWQGRPSVWGFARDVLKLHWVAGYFLFLMIWRAMSNSDQGVASVLQATIPLIVFAVAACLVILLVAWILSATTVYTITNRRVVIRKGAALSFTLNLPFRQLASADLVTKRDGSGSIVLEMSEPIGLSYLMLWPHVRPWMMAKPRPSLRSIKDAKVVSEILASAAATFVRDLSDAVANYEAQAAPMPAE